MSKDFASIPMHTAEHILNQTMVRMFGCKRSMNAHIERKKSKCDFFLEEAPTVEQVARIEQKVNEIIALSLDVTERVVPYSEAASMADLSKLPEGMNEESLRLVFVGDYDTCACIGPHVSNTREIGQFRILTHEFENGRWRMRFKLED